MVAVPQIPTNLDLMGSYPWLVAVATYLTYWDVKEMFQVSRLWRSDLSRSLQVAVYLSTVRNHARNRRTNCEIQLAMSTSLFWKVCIHAAAIDIPVPKSRINSLCAASISFPNWKLVRDANIHLMLPYNESVDMLEIPVRNLVTRLGRHDTLIEMFRSNTNYEMYYGTEEEPLSIPKMVLQNFNKLRHLTCDLQMLNEARYPLESVTRLKIFVPMFVSTNNMLGSLFKQIFPNLQRLSIQPALKALAMFGCLPEFEPPDDFKLCTMLSEREYYNEPTDLPGRKSRNLFVASHIYTLPVSWGLYFRNVTRLQLNILADKFIGGEAIVEMICTKMHNLKRLGTIAAEMHGPILESNLTIEELVLNIAASEAARFVFQSFLRAFERKRERIFRLGAHLGCLDGMARVNPTVENSLCAAWFAIAKLLSPNGFICFSVSDPQIRETKLLQYPWTHPQYFCFDSRDYTEDGTVQTSTPLEKSHWYYASNPNDRPIGSLINNERRMSNNVTIKSPETKPVPESISRYRIDPSENLSAILIEAIDTLNQYVA